MDQESCANREPKMILDQIPPTAETASDLELIIARQNLTRENFGSLGWGRRREPGCPAARCQICCKFGKLGNEFPVNGVFGTNSALRIRAALGDPSPHHFHRNRPTFLSVRSNDPIHRVPFPALPIARLAQNSQSHSEPKAQPQARLNSRNFAEARPPSMRLAAKSHPAASVRAWQATMSAAAVF